MRPAGLLLFVAALVVAASAAAAKTIAVPARLAGSYEAYLKRGGATQKGRWVLAIGARGRFVLTTPALDVLHAGPAQVNGGTLTLPPDASRGGRCSSPGIYTWSRTGSILRFARVDDACALRAYRLTTRPWRRFTQYAPVVIIRR